MKTTFAVFVQRKRCIGGLRSQHKTCILNTLSNSFHFGIRCRNALNLESAVGESGIGCGPRLAKIELVVGDRREWIWNRLSERVESRVEGRQEPSNHSLSRATLHSFFWFTFHLSLILLNTAHLRSQNMTAYYKCASTPPLLTVAILL